MTIFGRGEALKKENAKESNGHSGATKPTALIDGVTTPAQGFGIRSYLHQFYQSPTVEDIESAGAWYLLPPPPAQRRGFWLCRLLTVFGLFLLIGGAVAIVVGYTWPHEGVEESIVRIAIYQDEDGNFYIPPEKLSELLQDPMRRWKMIGLCIFASGAILLAISLLISTLAHFFKSKRLAVFDSEDSTPNEPAIRIYPAVGTKTGQNSNNAPNNDGKYAKISPHT
ncbi:unnamed protein product [Thelazia callipaeda]|uniref:SLC3A2_N domain-containing protein n=1 Tax=Thelazia callipaeda TaxID=103827 RepID=A0A0N5D951_THECL|nr:unnamed protein product [Thelazia callipaeda]